MKINTILNRYIFKEMLPPFAINVMFFTFIFVMMEMTKIANWVVNYSISLWVVILMIIYASPYFLIFVIPMSTMMTILLTYLRLSNDNEIIALKSGGASIYGLFPPVLFFSFISFLITNYLTLFVVPWSNVSIEKLALQVAASNVDIGLKERTFNDSFDDVMLYVNKVDLKNKKIIDIFIEDKRQPNMVSTVVAPEGRLISEPDKHRFHLQLFNGTIHQTNLKERSANAIRFDTYNVSLDLNKEFTKFEDKEKDPDEMQFSELRKFIKDYPTKDEDYWKAQIILHRKFAFPVACFALGLLAMPLGIQSKSAKASFGLILGLFFFFLYYMLLSAAIIFGETGAVHPAVGMYLPTVIVGIIGLYLFVQTARERTVPIVEVFQHIRRFVLKLRRK